MIKVLLFDIDGVIIHHKSFFENHLENIGFKNSFEIISQFDNSKLNEDLDRGIISTQKALKPILDKIGWKKSVKEYIIEKHNYEEEFIDFDLLQSIINYKSRGYIICVASNQNVERKSFLIEKMNLTTDFDECFFSCDFNVIKNNPEFWKIVRSRLLKIVPNIKNDEILFIDDSIKNIDSANQFGIKTIHYQYNENNDLLELIEEEISKKQNGSP